MDVRVQEKNQRSGSMLSRFELLYGKDHSKEYLARLRKLLASYGFNLDVEEAARHGWDETDAILITYGDVICDDEHPHKPKLQLLKHFLDEHLRDIISTVHILPLFPSSSDAGYSIIDYKKVRKDLGDWHDVEDIASKYRLMIDLVINHTSKYSRWFKNYQKGKSPGKDYFIEVQNTDDISQVARPRNSPLLTPVQTNRGLRHVWTTFSEDQVDLDFSNPDVLFKFIDIFLFFYSKGVRVIRFDAIAYLWKKFGTTSIHLKETHQIVKLFRDLAACIDPDITIITETNVPFEKNLSYFGDKDEAQMIYQFSLPPLLLHAILTENARYLTGWAAKLPELPESCTYLNFTASHDGIGVQPLLGLVPDDEIDYLVEGTKERGGFVSYKANPNGHETPYELNITYFDAFEKPGRPRTKIQMERYFCSQIIMLSLQGVPGIYFHSLTATKNNLEGVLETGIKRDINRKQWNRQILEDCLDDNQYVACGVLKRYEDLLIKRKAQPAFHPEGLQQVFDINNNLFSILRTAPNDEEAILVISNVSGKNIELEQYHIPAVDSFEGGVRDILSEEMLCKDETSLHLNPYQTVWLEL